MSEPAAAPADVGALIRSRDYIRLLVLSGGIGLVVALAAWCFLTVVPWIQHTIFEDIPAALSLDPAPWWWPLPVLAIAGLITAVVMVKMPGGGGRAPAEGLVGGGITYPKNLPGIIIAGLATLGLGLVLGPSAPVIALGMGLSLFLFRLVKKDAPDHVEAMIAGAGSFASFSLVFRNPFIAAVVIIEASGLGGPTLPLVVLPGLLGAGIGSIVYLGMGYITGLSTDQYAVTPLQLEPLAELTLVQILWAIVIALIAAILGFLVLEFGKVVERVVAKRKMLIVPVVGLLVAGLAIAYAQITGQPVYAVLFSGSAALDPVIAQSAVLSVGTMALLFLFKGLAWSLSTGSFRGGIVFPAIFLGTVLGLLASNLPGFPMGAAVPAALTAMVVSVLRLPLSSTMLGLLLCGSAGASAAPLVIVAMVVSYVTVMKLNGLRDARAKAATGSIADAPAVSGSTSRVDAGGAAPAPSLESER